MLRLDMVKKSPPVSTAVDNPDEDTATDDHSLVSSLRAWGFSRQLCLEGPALSNQISRQSNRVYGGHSSYGNNKSREEFWTHPNGILVKSSFYQRTTDKGWLLNEVKSVAFERKPLDYDHKQNPVEMWWYRQHDGCQVLQWRASTEEDIGRVVSWTKIDQGKSRKNDWLPFSEWEMLPPVSFLNLTGGLLLDWTDVKISSPGRFPIEQDRAKTRIALSFVSSLERALSHHLAGIEQGPGAPFWFKCLDKEISFLLSRAQAEGNMPPRPAATVRRLEKAGDLLGAEDSLQTESFHKGLLRAWAANRIQSFSDADRSVVAHWFELVHAPLEVFARRMSEPLSNAVLHGVDVLDVLCGLPFLNEGKEKILSLLDRMPPDALETRLKTEDRLGMNLTLRLVSSAGVLPSNGKEDKVDDQWPVPLGLAVLKEISSRVSPQAFVLETSRWSALAFFLGAGRIIDNDEQCSRRQRSFLQWLEHLNVSCPSVLRFPTGASNVLAASPATVSLVTAPPLLRQHPDFAIPLAPDLPFLKVIRSHLRAREMDQKFPLPRPANRPRF